jgi:hypothetical protein
MVSFLPQRGNGMPPMSLCQQCGQGQSSDCARVMRLWERATLNCSCKVSRNAAWWPPAATLACRNTRIDSFLHTALPSCPLPCLPPSSSYPPTISQCDWVVSGLLDFHLQKVSVESGKMCENFFGIASG